MRRDERVAQHLLHVAGIERRVADAVERRIDLRVLDRLGHVLDAHDACAARGAEVGDGARAGIEVVERLAARELREVARHLVEFVGLGRVGLIERLGPHLEPEALHPFDDVVLAPIAYGLQVARRVVPLGVHHVHERRDGGECGGQVVEQRRDALAVVGTEHHDDHHLARRGGAHDHVAHEARVLAGVVEGVAVLDAEALCLQADGVRRFGLEPAPADVEHLVEHARDVESRGGRGLDGLAGLHLLAGQPAAVGEGVFEFVAVEPRLGRPEAGGHLGQLDLADAGELVAHLAGLEAQLLVVGQVLPLAASADAEVLAEGFGTVRRPLHVAHHGALHVAAALHADLHVHHVARHGHRHEDHHLLPAAHRLAFGGQRGYLKTLDQRVVRFLSCHRSLRLGLQR